MRKFFLDKVHTEIMSKKNESLSYTDKMRIHEILNYKKNYRDVIIPPEEYKTMR